MSQSVKVKFAYIEIRFGGNLVIATALSRGKMEIMTWITYGNNVFVMANERRRNHKAEIVIEKETVIIR